MDPRYPIGNFAMPAQVSAESRAALIHQLATLPDEMRAAVEELNEEQLDTPYRDGGWTVRQVVHHVPDSHMNSFIRFKLALTEDNPTIKPYDEAAWAKLSDAGAPIDASLVLLEALHERWVTLLESMTDADFARTLRHPESGSWRLDQMLALYAWHGRHHVAHVKQVFPD